MTRSCKPQEFHYNAISDDDNQAYIYYDPYVFFVNLNGPAIRVIDTIDVSYNWWNTTDSTLIASRLRSNSSSAKYMFMPLWQMGISKEKNTADEILLAEANEYVENGNYSEAKAIYMQIVEEYPTRFREFISEDGVEWRKNELWQIKRTQTKIISAIFETDELCTFSITTTRLCKY